MFATFDHTSFDVTQHHTSALSSAFHLYALVDSLWLFCTLWNLLPSIHPWSLINGASHYCGAILKLFPFLEPLVQSALLFSGRKYWLWGLDLGNVWMVMDHIPCYTCSLSGRKGVCSILSHSHTCLWETHALVSQELPPMP